MTFDKISLTLFDVLSYLLPGYVLLFALSIVESTFFDTSLLTLSVISSNWVISSIMSYFLGQISHRLGSIIKNKKTNWFQNQSQQLSRPVYYHTRNLLTKMHDIKFEEGERLHSLETYLLAESYVVASGKTVERDSLLAREGFHKTSMSSFALATLFWLSTLFAGGAKIQQAMGTYISIGYWQTVGVCGILLVITAIFRQGYIFYNRLKINNVLLLAMTLRSLDEEKRRGQTKES